MSELSERLREAHPNSQQYALGSNILLEAAQEIESLQAQLSEAWAELATARAGWQETIAKMASQERPAYDEQQQRIAKLEAEKAKLVEALEEALHHVVISPGPVRGDFIQEIEAALAAHRKQEEES